MHAPIPNPFREFWSRGFRDLLPVIPADATGVNSPGKCPGVLMADGKWQGRDRKVFRGVTEAQLEEWHRWRAGVGIRCNAGIVAVDIDTLSEEWSKKIAAIVIRGLGKSAVRIGQAPKQLVVFRAPVTTKYRQIRFQDGVNEKGALVELLAGANCWFVAAGIHPKTGKPYVWPEGVPAASELAFASAEALEELFDTLKAELPASKLSGSGSGAGVDQKTLAGAPGLIVEAFGWIKNDFTKVGYAQWIEMAAALHGALPNDLGTAESLFVEWSAGYVNPQCSAYKMFWSVVPPFKLGAQYIYDKAAEGGWDIANRWCDRTVLTDEHRVEPDEDIYIPPPPADDDEDDAPPPPSDFPFSESDKDDKPRTWKHTPAREISPASIEPREWLYGRFLIRGRVSLTVAPSETGKTGLGIVNGLAMASGKSLLGIHPFAPLRVAIWNGEDPLEELERRVQATMLCYGLTWADLGGRLFLDSGFGKDGIAMEIASSDRKGLLMNHPQIRAFTESIRANQIDVQILDPLVSTHDVPENDNSALDKVAKTFARVADETNCAVDLYHHTRKSGGVGGRDMTVDDARGGGSLGAAVRARQALQTMQPEQGRDLGIEPKRQKYYFRIADSGNNMAPPDEETMRLEMRNVLLPNGRPTPGRPGDEVGVPVRWRPDLTAILPQDVIDRILTEVDTGQWRQARSNSEQWIGHLIAREHSLDVDNAKDKAFIKKTIERMTKAGILTTVNGNDTRGRPAIFYARGKDAKGFV